MQKIDITKTIYIKSDLSSQIWIIVNYNCQQKTICFIQKRIFCMKLT